MIRLLMSSGVALAYSILSALYYEIHAAVTSQEPVISAIIIPWVRAHNVWASLIVGGVVGFLTFLVLHVFGSSR